MRKKSQSLLTNGLLSVKVSGANSSFFYFSSESIREFCNDGIHCWNFRSTSSTVSLRNSVITNSICKCTLIIALPMKVALKKVVKGILK